MGQNRSQIIKYRSKLLGTMVEINLQDKFKYASRPLDKEVNKQFNQLLSEIIIKTEDKDIIKSLPISFQWKLICRHKKYISKNMNLIPEGQRTEVLNLVERIRVSPNLIELQNIKRWLGKATYSEFQSFLMFDGINHLLTFLNLSEMSSRLKKNYSKQIELMKVIFFYFN